MLKRRKRPCKERGDYTRKGLSGTELLEGSGNTRQCSNITLKAFTLQPAPLCFSQYLPQCLPMEQRKVPPFFRPRTLAVLSTTSHGRLLCAYALDSLRPCCETFTWPGLGPSLIFVPSPSPTGLSIPTLILATLPNARPSPRLHTQTAITKPCQPHEHPLNRKMEHRGRTSSNS